MKKYLSILVMVFMITSIFTPIYAIGEEKARGNTKTSIQFRNIPWGTTAGYFIDNIGGVNIPNSEFNWWKGDTTIPNKGWYCYVSSVYQIAYFMNCPYDVNYIDSDTYENIPGRILTWHNYSSNKSSSLKVAGYDITDVKLYFIQPVEGGIVNHDKEAAKFYMGEYRIEDNVDRVSVYEDFSTKLTTLYGNMYYELKEDQIVRVWKDSQGNTVSLIRYDTSWENLDDIEIVYMAGTAMKDIQALNAALYNEQSLLDSNKREENSNNFDGL